MLPTNPNQNLIMSEEEAKRIMDNLFAAGAPRALIGRRGYIDVPAERRTVRRKETLMSDKD